MSLADLSGGGICPSASKAFANYFETLGYKIYWEGRLETGERWYECYDDGQLVFQISMPPPPLAELREDLPKILRSERTDGPTVYWIACPNTEALRTLLSRMESHSAAEASA